MTDGQLLLIAFAFFYLMECLRWLPDGAWLISGLDAGRWRERRIIDALRGRGLGAAMVRWLPPLQPALAVMPWPFVPTKDGLQVLPPEARQPVILPWGQVKPARDGAKVHAGGDTPAVRFIHEPQAQEWCAALQQWAELPDDRRDRAFAKFTRGTLNVEAVEKQGLALERRTRWLRFIGELILMWLFIGVAVMYWRFGDRWQTFAAVGLLFFLMLAQSVLFLLAARPKHGAPVPWRHAKALAILVFPPQAIHAAEIINRLPSPVPHPLAALRLLREDAWKRGAAILWKTVRYRPGWEDNAPRADEAVMQKFLQQQKVDIAALEQPAARVRPGDVYCPRCEATYTAQTSACQDCGGVALRARPAEEIAPN